MAKAAKASSQASTKANPANPQTGAPPLADKPAPKTKAVASGDDAPDTKKTTKEAKAAAEQLFTGADNAQRNEEQHANFIRRQALGY